MKQERNRHVSDLQGQGSETHSNSHLSLSPSLSVCSVLFERKGSPCHHVSLLVSMLAVDEAVCLSVLLLVKSSPKADFSGAIFRIGCVFFKAERKAGSGAH